MNNKDIICLHMAYSRLDWNPAARGVAGGGCKISPEVIFTNNNDSNKKQNEVSILYIHACYSYTGWIELPRKVGCRGV